MKRENIIIIILLILTLGLSGYIIYDKTNNNEIDQEQTNNETNNENQNNNNSSITTEVSSKFSGKYLYETVTSDDICVETNAKPKETIEFELNDDGTYTYSHGFDCGGGEISNGNFYIDNEKIYLIDTNYDCKPIFEENEVILPNCHTVIELNYTIKNNKFEMYSIYSDTNAKKVYEKQ